MFRAPTQWFPTYIIIQRLQSHQKLYEQLRVEFYLILFLAHLSRRLVGEFIVYPWSGVRPSSVVVHNFKHEYLCNQWADCNQILSEASLGWGKGCIWFWARSDQNSGFHGNRKLPYGYNGENGVSTFSRLFYIWSFSYLQAMITCMRARTSANFGLIGPPTAELAALERLKKSPYAYNGKNDVSTFSRLFLIRSFSYLQVMITCMRALMSLKFGQIQPLVSIVTDKVMMKKKTTVSPLFLGCFSSVPFHTCR